MRRLFWTAVGAAGGIFVYRRGERRLEIARERGMIGTLSDAAKVTAALATATARATERVAQARRNDPPPMIVSVRTVPAAEVTAAGQSSDAGKANRNAGRTSTGPTSTGTSVAPAPHRRWRRDRPHTQKG